MSTVTLTLVAVAGVLWGVGANVPALARGEYLAITEMICGWSFIASGLIGWRVRPDNRTGKLLTITGFLWFVESLGGHLQPLAWTIGESLSGVWIMPFVYLVLSFPEGRLRLRKDRVLFRLTLLAGIPMSILWLALVPRDECLWCYLNLISINDSRAIGLGYTAFWYAFVMGLAIALVVVVAPRYRRASVTVRRVLGPGLMTGTVALFALLAVGVAATYISFLERHEDVIRRLIYPGLWATPFGFLIGLLRARARRARVGELVVELGELPSPDRFQEALRKTLGDPHLTVGFWVSDDLRYVGSDGRTLEIPEPDGAQATTFIDRAGERLAVIIHDRWLLDDPGLIRAVGAASRLAVENERLQEEVMRQLAEVQASRARLVQAQDEERRRLERNLHDGAQQRLVALSLALRSAEEALGEEVDPQVRGSLASAAAELKTALGELRELAQGIHPAVLTEQGLGAALESLAARSGIPVEIMGAPEERLPAPVEAAAYFVVSEALANVAKYARAGSASVLARRDDGHLRVEVSDDGVGGATFEQGTGLRGLADRVQALDGEFEVDSPPGKGTRVIARIPCE